jgi:hypothetical protein
MQKIVELFMKIDSDWSTVFFGLGIQAPIIAALLTVSDAPLPGGLSPIVVGLAVGLVWGLFAKYWKRWI